MTIETKSKFYYVDAIDETNFRLDFNEGGPNLVAEIDVGSYSPEQLLLKISEAMNDIGTLDYLATMDRVTRKVTISASAPFTLLISSGASAGTSIFPVIGFTGSDASGTSITGSGQIGYEYAPQFWLQNYVDFEDFQESVDAKINESASGLVEVVSFGTVEFAEMNITFVTDRKQANGAAIDSDQSALQSLRLFMRHITKKIPFEFMKDRSDPNEYFIVILESTSRNKAGTGYQLSELSGRGLNGFFETGRLTLRKVE